MIRFILALGISFPLMAEAKAPPANEPGNGQVVGRPTTSVDCGDGIVVIVAEHVSRGESRELAAICGPIKTRLAEIAVTQTYANNQTLALNGSLAAQKTRTIDISRFSNAEILAMPPEKLMALATFNIDAREERVLLPDGGFIEGPGASGYGATNARFGRGDGRFIRRAMSQDRGSNSYFGNGTVPDRANGYIYTPPAPVVPKDEGAGKAKKSAPKEDTSGLESQRDKLKEEIDALKDFKKQLEIANMNLAAEAQKPPPKSDPK